MLDKSVITCYYIINNTYLWLTNSYHPEGESMKIDFDGIIKLEFHGTKVSSNGGILAHRELDDALVLFDSISAVFNDKRTGRNIHTWERTADIAKLL